MRECCADPILIRKNEPNSQAGATTSRPRGDRDAPARQPGLRICAAASRLGDGLHKDATRRANCIGDELNLPSPRKWYAESVDPLATAVHPRPCHDTDCATHSSAREGAAAADGPIFLNQPRCAMARKPTKPQHSRTGMKSVSVYLSPEKRRKVKILAAMTGTTINALMRRAVDFVLAEHKGKPRKRRRGV